MCAVNDIDMVFEISIIRWKVKRKIQFVNSSSGLVISTHVGGNNENFFHFSAIVGGNNEKNFTARHLG